MAVRLDVTLPVCADDLAGLLFEKACACQTIHEQVKIDEPRISSPFTEDTRHSSVIERFPQLEPACKIVSGPHVVAGKDIRPSQTTQQNVLCGPAPNPTNIEQPSDRFLIIDECQSLKVHTPRGDCGRRFDQSTTFVGAESELL